MSDVGCFGIFRQLLNGGYSPDSVVQAALANDLSLLQYSAPFSVQLQEPEEDSDG